MKTLSAQCSAIGWLGFSGLRQKETSRREVAVSYQIRWCSLFTAISAVRDKWLLQAFFSHPKIRLHEILKPISLPTEEDGGGGESSLKQTAEKSQNWEWATNYGFAPCLWAPMVWHDCTYFVIKVFLCDKKAVISRLLASQTSVKQMRDFQAASLETTRSSAPKACSLL